jgi:hypothetical protein
MNKISLFIVFTVLWVTNLSGQSYHNLIEPNKTWDVTWSICGYAPCSYYTTTFKIDGDTLINNLKYSKLLDKRYESTNYGKPGVFLREDTIHRKVFLYNPKHEDEALLYDFSLMENDSVTVQGVETPSLLVVDSVTETLINNHVRKQIVFVEDQFHDGVWIEGIGSNHGLLFSDFNKGLIDAGNSLNCVHLGDSLLYMDTNLWTCNSTNISVEKVCENMSQIQVLQQPLRFVFNKIETENSNLQIYCINGKKIADFQINGEEIIAPDQTYFQSGLYIYIFKSRTIQKQGKFTIIYP